MRKVRIHTRERMRLILFVLVPCLTAAQVVIPTQYSIPADEVASVNGSSATGHCSNVTTSGNTTTCTAPASSVLFDGNIPTLTGLDGDMWASQLLVLQASQTHGTVATEINFYFADNTLINRVELVLFNCPQLTSVRDIQYLQEENLLASKKVPVTFCTAPVRVCTSLNAALSILTVEFFPPTTSRWVHLAEVTFLSNGITNCPPDAVIATPTVTTHTSGAIATPVTSDDPKEISRLSATPVTSDDPFGTIANQATLSVTGSRPTQTPPDSTNTQCEECPTNSVPIILASVITAIATALLATAIFALVQVTLYMCHPKSTHTNQNQAPSIEVEEAYEQMGVAAVALSDPTYMEVAAGREQGRDGNSLEMKENDAYIL